MIVAVAAVISTFAIWHLSAWVFIEVISSAVESIGIASIEEVML